MVRLVVGQVTPSTMPMLLQYRTGVLWGANNEPNQADILIPAKIVKSVGSGGVTTEAIKNGRDAVVAIQCKHTSNFFRCSAIDTALNGAKLPSAFNIISKGDSKRQISSQEEMSKPSKKARTSNRSFRQVSNASRDPQQSVACCDQQSIVADTPGHSDFDAGEVVAGYSCVHIPMVIMLQDQDVQPLNIKSTSSPVALRAIREGRALVGKVPSWFVRKSEMDPRSTSVHLRCIQTGSASK
jgi:hypothetical protein